MTTLKKEFTISASAGICLVDDEGKLIMVRQRENQLWGIPAGHVESRESPVATMFRELEEETGIGRSRVKDLELLGVYSIIRNEQRTSMGIVMRGRISGNYNLMPQDRDIDKIDAFGSVFIDTFLRRPQWLYIPEFNWQVITDWRNGKRNLIF